MSIDCLKCKKPYLYNAATSYVAGRTWLTCTLTLILICHSPLSTKADPRDRIRVLSAATADTFDWGGCTRYFPRTHSIGNIGVGVSGWGSLGFAGSDCNGRYVPNIEFPYGSGAEYILPAIIFGGVRRGDTLVSSGEGGYGGDGFELWPFECVAIQRISPRLRESTCAAEYVTDSAISDQDIIAIFGDNVSAEQAGIDPEFGRVHLPLGIEVKQTSYSWADGIAGNFVIVEYEITNVGVRQKPGERDTIYDFCVGWVLNPRAAHSINPLIGSDDNLVEYLPSIESSLRPGHVESLPTMIGADNDGDPSANGYWLYSVPDVVGVSLLSAPMERPVVSFNWWTEGWWTPETSWGPIRSYSDIEFLSGGLGIPEGDRSAYRMMTSGEVDYPQVEALIDHSAQGWLPPTSVSGLAENIADGYVVNALMSVGTFDLPPDSTVTVTIAIVGGRDYHTDPSNFKNIFDPLRPELYKSLLDKSDLIRNINLARSVYDNPGVDTDKDGYAGEWYLRNGDTVYFKGDGVPDLRVSSPPFTPIPDILTRQHRISLRWNGARTETEDDIFTVHPDFEGYRIYMSRTGRESDWWSVAQRDLFNFARYTWNRGTQKWEMNDRPFTLDSLAILYDSLCWNSYGHAFSVDSFTVPLVSEALLEVQFDPADPVVVDSIYRYFGPYEINNSPEDVSLRDAEAAGLDVAGVIRKLYPASAPTDTMIRDDGTPFRPFYEYEYVFKNLQLSEPVFVTLTAFDHGEPPIGLKPLESSKAIASQEIWPINSTRVVKEERPKVGVYPNPYRIFDQYNANGWENRRGLEPDQERARQVTFYNVPDTCTLSIWSLDGDLVRELKHAAEPSSSDATVVVWNLITRNTQAVKTGIYIYSVESRFGTDVGKLVIIK